jgi:Kef-type K+ transport system membrane component KefB
VDLLNLNAPSGTAWELFIAAAVIVIGPLIVERFRTPGMIGLLVGGLVIGPSVLGIVPPEGGVVHEFGDVGLLYLMFLAGLELDLNIFARHRRHAVTFAGITFAGPAALGIAAGLGLGYETDAAILLGSLCASHTLVTYPIVRRFGLSTNPAVAVAVGATVMTDTLALIVLAVIAGRTTGSAGGGELAVQVVLGLGILVTFCFGLLPPLTRWYFTTIGRQRVLRYTYALGVLLGGATLAGSLGIEPIVGAFFTGLAINRLVPNEGEFMEHIEFFGSALLIPIFLVSVGTIIDPRVLLELGTLGIALVLIGACVGGKLLASLVSGPAFGYSRDEVGVVFSLTVPQAAATLAATLVGLRIGLFDESTVNAVMVLIAVSLIVGSAAATFFGARVPRPSVDASRLARSVLVDVDPTEPNDRAVSIAARLARVDGGVIRPVVVVGDGAARPGASELERLDAMVGRTGFDADLEVRHDRSKPDGILHAQASYDSSLVVLTATADNWLPTLSGSSHSLVRSLDVPVAFVHPGSARVTRVVLLLGPNQARRPRTSARLAVEVAARLQRSGLPVVVVLGGLVEPGLLDPLGAVECIAADGPTWVATQVRPTDEVVVPGGRSDNSITSRTARVSGDRGATVVAVVSSESIGMTVDAVDTLGIVPAS